MAAANTHACIICKKTTSKGRFTRPDSGISGSWTKKSLPAWYCYAATCLPLGKGRGESAEESVTQALKPAKPVAGVTDTPGKAMVVSPKAILADRTEGTAKLGPLQADVQQLPAVLTSQDEYDAADALLKAVNVARKWWKDRMYGTKAQPGPIPSIRSGLDMLYALNSEVDKPLGDMVDLIKGKMTGYVRKQLDEKREADAAVERERLRAEQELEEASRKLAAAKTPQQVAKATAMVEEKEEAYVETLNKPTIEVGKADSGEARVPKKPKVTNILQFCQGIANGDIPVECIEIKQGMLNSLYREVPEVVAEFLGVTIEDDIQIVGRT